MKRLAPPVVGAVIALVVLWFVGLLPNAPSHPDAEAAAPRKQAPPSSQSGGIPKPNERPRISVAALDSEAPGALWEVLVQDLDGNPLPGVRVDTTPPGRRELLVENPQITDGSGRATVEATIGHDIVASKPGWITASTTPAREFPVHRISMQKGESLRISVRDVWGAPLPGARVTLSRSALSRDTEFGVADTTPGPGPHSVHRGVADGRGITEVSGLSPGRYLIRVASEGRVPVDGPEDWEIVVPGGDCEVTMEPLVALIGDLPEGALLAAFAADRELRRWRSARPVSQPALSQARNQWSQSTDRLCVVGLGNPTIRNALRDGERQNLRMHVLVQDRGWGIVEAPLELLPELSTPSKLYPEWSSGCGTAVVTLRSPSGHSLASGRVRAYVDNPIGARTLIYLPLGEECSLPPGRVEIDRLSLPCDAVSLDFEVVSGRRQDVEIRVQEGCRSLDLSASLPDGSTPQFCTFTFRPLEGKSKFKATYDGNISAIVGSGEIEVLCQAAGTAPAVLRIRADGPIAMTETCVLEWN